MAISFLNFSIFIFLLFPIFFIVKHTNHASITQLRNFHVVLAEHVRPPPQRAIQPQQWSESRYFSLDFPFSCFSILQNYNLDVQPFCIWFIFLQKKRTANFFVLSRGSGNTLMQTRKPTVSPRAFLLS